MTLSPAGSGDAAQWAASITDRRGSGDQALNGAHRAPAPLPAFFRRKLGKELHSPPPRTCASGSMSTSAASCPRRELPGVQPPRTCASLLMSTSAASCHGRELSRAATRREWTAEALRPPGTGSAQHPQVLQQNLQAHQNQDNAAGQLGFALILGAEQAAHLHAHHGQREGDNPDKAHRRADVHA